MASVIIQEFRVQGPVIIQESAAVASVIIQESWVHVESGCRVRAGIAGLGIRSPGDS